MKKADLCLWEISDKLGICDSGFSRKLRKELTQNEKDKIRNIIVELKKEGKENNA